MPLELEIVNPVDVTNWDEYVLSSSKHSFFHTAAWARVLADSYGYKPLYFVLRARDKFKVLMPVMEIRSRITGRRAVSLPFSDYCEPIISDEICINGIMDQIRNYGKTSKWDSIQIRGGGDYFNGTPSETYYRHRLALTNEVDKIFSKFKSNIRRNIRKAQRNGVTVKIANSFVDVKEFYRLNCITRKHHGLPPQPFYFFINIFKHIINPKKGFVVQAAKGNRIIASAVFFHFGQNAVYKYGASERKYQHLRPNNLIMWEAIKWYAKNCYQTLCFGRTETGNHGLRRFKTSWATEEAKINYFKYDLKKEAFIRQRNLFGGWTGKIFTQIPIPVSKVIGRICYRHAG